MFGTLLRREAEGAEVYFVPEGQHDSSQARSAWDYEENSPVPAGRLNRSCLRNHSCHPKSGRTSSEADFSQEYLAFLKQHEHSTRCRLLMPGLRFDDKLPLELTMPSTVPPGRGLSASPTQALRAWLLSWLSLRDENHSPIEAPRIESALMG
jgi:hypothetical protein